MSTYFVPTPETLSELKAMYRKLAMLHHPDRGGDTEVMKQINNDYDLLFDAVKTFHKNAEGEKYTKTTVETPDYFKDIIDALIKLKMQDVSIELIGSFLWLSGGTRVYKNEIKALGFKWSQNKQAWMLSPPGYRKHNNKQYTMSDIRGMFGSAFVTGEDHGKTSGTVVAIHA